MKCLQLCFEMGYGKFLLVFQVSSILLATSVSGQFTPSPIDKFRTGGNLNQQSLRIPIRVQNELAPAVAGPTVHNPRQVGTFVQPLRQTLPQQNLQPTLTFPQSSQIRTTLLQQSSGTRPVTVPSSQPVNGVPIPVQNDFAPTQPSGTRPVTTPNSQPANDAQAQEDVTQSPEQILFQEQAENAKYSFDAAITDNIMDHSHVRKESRDGLAVSGLYSYSDGYYKRTVHYRADENGYRVTKEEVEPIGEGPQVNLDGDAVVSTNVGGVDNKYRITAADIAQWQRNPES
ncbi:hypothetical protein C0J52_10734 [Blattella germanica]|nr:hypothetical protein C0J52_10734 [Blattella germanica]